VRFWTTEKSLDFVKAAYDAGAERVFAVHINPDRYADEILIELPTDRERRSRVFKWAAMLYNDPYDRPEDFAQSYIKY
jgi:hypothetical protein